MASSVFLWPGSLTFTGALTAPSLTLSSTVAQGAAITFSAASASGAYIGADSTTAISFRNTRVGIGTLFPSKGILHVNDGASFSEASPISSTLLPSGTVQLLTGSSAATLVGMVADNTISHQPGLYLRSVRARGTYQTPLINQVTDLLGFWECEGYTGSARVALANIGMFVEDVSGSTLSGYINFLTAALGGSTVERARITSNGIGIGVSPQFGSSAVNVLSILNGTEPGSSPADTVQLYSVDLSAGNATLGLRTETAVVTETVVSDRTLSVRINGTTYKICLKV